MGTGIWATVPGDQNICPWLRMTKIINRFTARVQQNSVQSSCKVAQGWQPTAKIITIQDLCYRLVWKQNREQKRSAHLKLTFLIREPKARFMAVRFGPCTPYCRTGGEVIGPLSKHATPMIKVISPGPLMPQCTCRGTDSSGHRADGSKYNRQTHTHTCRGTPWRGNRDMGE